MHDIHLPNFKGPIRSGKDMRILISGGGIAGLTLAALLQQRGFTPTLVEQAPEYGGIGYVLGLWPAGSRVLKGLGLYDKFLKIGQPFSKYEILTEKGKLLNSYDLTEIEEKFGPFLSIYRADLISLLSEAVNPSSIRHGWKILHIHQDDSSAKVTFENGSTEKYDLVVLAEGINSHTRPLVFEDTPLTYSGMSGWALWIDETSSDPLTVQEYWGKNGFCGIYPAKGRTCAFLATHRPPYQEDPTEKRTETIKKAFKDFEGAPKNLIEKITNSEEIFHTDFFDIKTPEWVNKRVVMIGDTAHAVLPTGGVGATLAMESAAVLAEELCRADSKYLSYALSNYVKRRRKRVDRIQSESRGYGKVMFLQNSIAVALRNWFVSISGSKSLFKYWEDLFKEVL